MKAIHGSALTAFSCKYAFATKPTTFSQYYFVLTVEKHGARLGFKVVI